MKEQIVGLLEKHAHDTDMHGWATKDETWTSVVAVLLAKSVGTENIQDYRPMHMLAISHKLYLKCVLLIVKVHWGINGMWQVGCRSGHQAAVLVAVVRIM